MLSVTYQHSVPINMLLELTQFYKVRGYYCFKKLWYYHAILYPYIYNELMRQISLLNCKNWLFLILLTLKCSMSLLIISFATVEVLGNESRDYMIQKKILWMVCAFQLLVLVDSLLSHYSQEQLEGHCLVSYLFKYQTSTCNEWQCLKFNLYSI